MAKTYDTVMKQLLDEFAIDWVGWLAPQVGLPADVKVEPHEVDLSTVQVTADKVFRLKAPSQGFLHIEPQSSWDDSFPIRILCYNVLIELKYGGPVHTVVLLLRPEAQSSGLNGEVVLHHAGGDERLRFRYGMIRVWELPAKPLIEGPLGAAPLALLTNEAAPQLKGYVQRLDERLTEENVDPASRNLLLTSCYLLLGLRYDDVSISEAFLGVSMLEESTTYQAILRRGRQEGRQEGMQEGRQEGRQEGMQEGRQEGALEARREMLLDVLGEKFGKVPTALEEQIRESANLGWLQRAIRQAVTMKSLAELTPES